MVRGLPSRGPRGVRRLCVLAAVASLAVGCGSGRSAGELRSVSPRMAAGGAFPDMAAHATHTFGGLAICVTGAPATITSVAPRMPINGFSVQAWGVRPLPNDGLGEDRRPLAAFPSFTHRAVTQQC